MRKLKTVLIGVLVLIATGSGGFADTALVEIRLPETRVGVVYVNPDGSVASIELDDEAKTEVPVIDLKTLGEIAIKEWFDIPFDLLVWEDRRTGSIFYCPRWWISLCRGMEMEEAFEGRLAIHVDELGRVSKVVDPQGSQFQNRVFILSEVDVEAIELVSVHTYCLVEFSKNGEDMLGVIDLAASR